MLALLVFLLLVTAGIMAGCSNSSTPPQDQGNDQTGGGDGGQPDGTTQPSPQYVQVSMESIAFVPQTVTIKVGGTIEWVNNESAPHDVVFADFQSETVNRGGKITRTFNTVGTFTYFCSIHGQDRMNGTVVVTP